MNGESNTTNMPIIITIVPINKAEKSIGPSKIITRKNRIRIKVKPIKVTGIVNTATVTKKNVNVIGTMNM